MNENEELCGKVKNAQTLSRRDSLRSKHLETELAHVKDEFERLKLEYDNTRQHVNILDVRLWLLDFSIQLSREFNDSNGFKWANLFHIAAKTKEWLERTGGDIQIIRGDELVEVWPEQTSVKPREQRQQHQVGLLEAQVGVPPGGHQWTKEWAAISSEFIDLHEFLN